MNLKAKKSLGQNFLKSERALDKIIETGEINPDDFVLEIGPGKGALTKRILDAGATVLAIEKDNRLTEFLEQSLEKYLNDKFYLINGDILTIDLEKIETISKDYKLIANIPYYITGEIIKRFLTAKNQPKIMVLLVQKEVAERIVSTDKKESILSISVKAYCDPIFVEVVKAGSFVPMPEVDSAIIKFENINKNNFKNISEKLFFDIVHVGFSSKRKMLKGNLKTKFESRIIDKVFAELKIDPKIRAEDLSIEVWVSITEKIFENI